MHIVEFLRVADRNKHLIWILTQRDILDRYTGHFLGPIWAVTHPLFLMAFYVFVFTYLFPQPLAPATSATLPPFPVYIFSGLLPWLACTEMIGRASTLISDNSVYVKQVTFPAEALPIRITVGSFVNQFVATTAIFAYLVATGTGPTVAWLLLPIILLLQLAFMLGVCCVLAILGAFIRDLRDALQMFLTIGLFIAPILYSPERIESFPLPMKVVLFLNPFSHIVWCYQDLIFFGSVLHPWSWIISAVLAVTLFVLGLGLFAKIKHAFGEIV